MVVFEPNKMRHICRRGVAYDVKSYEDHINQTCLLTPAPVTISNNKLVQREQ